MGDPRRFKKKYTKPIHPWQKERIEEEKALKKNFGLKNKKEIWKAHSLLRNFYRQSKKLVPLRTSQSEIEKTRLLTKLKKLGLLKETAALDSVLNITLNDLLNRRLQTIVFKKGLAKTISQARQMVVHEHIAIGDKKMTIPSYLISVEEEALVNFAPDSQYINPEHPQRIQPVKRAAKKERPKAEYRQRRQRRGSRR